MADSIRERIVQNVVTTLQGVTEENGYEVTLREVLRIAVSPFDANALPVAVVAETSEEEEEGLPALYSRCNLSLEIVVALSEYTSISSMANKTIASIKKALQADQHRGGLALDTDITGNEVVVAQEVSPYGMVTVSLIVSYRHLIGDPYSQ